VGAASQPGSSNQINGKVSNEIFQVNATAPAVPQNAGTVAGSKMYP
jgi:hypothetical protein